MILPVYAGWSASRSRCLKHRPISVAARCGLHPSCPAARVPGRGRGLDLHLLADARRLHRAGAHHERAVHRDRHLQHSRRGAAVAAAYSMVPIVIIVAYLVVARKLGAFESL